MSWYFYNLVKGATPTFLQASFANKVLKALNALGNITINSGSSDSVEYSSDGVYITYASAGDLTTTLRLLDPANLNQVTINIEKGVIKKITTASSGLVWKTIQVCEGGSTSNYTFLTKS